MRRFAPLLCVLSGCSFAYPVADFEGSPKARDAGDSGDTGSTDAGAEDVGPADAGAIDGGPRDGGPRDGGPRDGGPRCLIDAGYAHCADFDRQAAFYAEWTGVGGSGSATTLSRETTAPLSPPGALRADRVAIAQGTIVGANVYQLFAQPVSERRYRWAFRLLDALVEPNSVVIASFQPDPNPTKQSVSIAASTTQFTLYNELTQTTVVPAAIGTVWHVVEVRLGAQTSVWLDGVQLLLRAPMHSFPLGPTSFSLGLPYSVGPAPSASVLFDDVVVVEL